MRLTAVVAAAGLGLASSIDSAAPAPAGGCVLARAGQAKVTEDDLRLRLDVLRARRVADPDEAQALAQLLAEALQGEVARQHAASPTVEEIESLDRHALLTSRDPAALAAMRDLFGADAGAFARQVLAPVATAIKLRERYALDPQAHSRERRRCEAALARARGGATLADAARAIGLQARVRVLAADRDASLFDIARGLPDDTLHGRIIETEEALRVLRRIRLAAAGLEVEEIEVAKRPFDAWYREAARGIPIELEEPALARDLCRAHGDAWWLAHTCSGTAR